MQTENAVGATVAQGNSVEDDDDVEADGVTGDGRRQRVTLVSVVVGQCGSARVSTVASMVVGQSWVSVGLIARSAQWSVWSWVSVGQSGSAQWSVWSWVSCGSERVSTVVSMVVGQSSVSVGHCVVSVVVGQCGSHR